MQPWRVSWEFAAGVLGKNWARGCFVLEAEKCTQEDAELRIAGFGG